MAVDSTSAVNLTDVLKASTVTSATPSSNKSASLTGASEKALGKDAFLQLLVTQMQNQNPLDPQDNSEFVAQLAQFSSLEGISSLNESVTSISSALGSSRALQASSLVGRSVVVQNDQAVVDTSKSLNGSVVLPQSVSGATVSVSDTSGKVIKTIELGPQSAGNASFIWDGTNASGEKVDPGTYRFDAKTTVDGASVALGTLLPATVTSVTLSQTGGEMMLNLSGVGQVALSKVQTIGI
ncbi:flagellar hook assembly protein FlgD [Pseudomonas monteilii]|jgi:flagellar basal-body rod modification protein FlgD|uniref:flagellar hook assembly protein FlgD n=1 Tax=Pseudomonas alabamensis TaxID=3064349 RepID=UPI00119D635D|nr:flagellar hook assembly protein FlgD [Pseudomonas sp. 22-AL-CL-001]MDO7909112.1 flagellar hook assembly protein FlgD [Pseudomonas sp. 22-AL-CL-001]